MATFITSLILYGFIAFVIGAIGKLIYEVQQNKKQEKESEFESKDRFQKLAGIGQPKNEIDPEIWKHIADKVSKEGFPEPDKSIPVVTAKITTIDTKFEESDPLSSVPMSRISKEAKKKMAEIAKEDINIQLEQNAEKFSALFPNEVSENDQRVGIELVKVMMEAPKVKPKRKSNPKQMDGIKTEGEFKKTRKKATKKTK